MWKDAEIRKERRTKSELWAHFSLSKGDGAGGASDGGGDGEGVVEGAMGEEGRRLLKEFRP